MMGILSLDVSPKMAWSGVVIRGCCGFGGGGGDDFVGDGEEEQRWWKKGVGGKLIRVLKMVVCICIFTILTVEGLKMVLCICKKA